MSSTVDPFQTPRTTEPARSDEDGQKTRWWLYAMMVFVVATTGAIRTLAFQRAVPLDLLGSTALILGLGFAGPFLAAAVALVSPRSYVLIGAMVGVLVAAILSAFDATIAIGYHLASFADDAFFVLVGVVLLRRTTGTTERIRVVFLGLFVARIIGHTLRGVLTFGSGMVNGSAIVVIAIAVIGAGLSLSLLRERDRDGPPPITTDRLGWLLLGIFVIGGVNAYVSFGPSTWGVFVPAAVGIAVVLPLVLVTGRRAPEELLLGLAGVTIGAAAFLMPWGTDNIGAALMQHALIGMSDGLWFIVAIPLIAGLRQDRWAPMVVAGCMLFDRLSRRLGGYARGVDDVSPWVAVSLGIVVLSIAAVLIGRGIQRSRHP